MLCTNIFCLDMKVEFLSIRQRYRYFIKHLQNSILIADNFCDSFPINTIFSILNLEFQ